MSKAKNIKKKNTSGHMSTEGLIEHIKRSLPLEVEVLRPYRYQVSLPKGVFDFIVLDLSVPQNKEEALRNWRRSFQSAHNIAVYIHRASSMANLRKEIEDIAQGVELLSKKQISSIQWRIRHFYGDVPRLNDVVRTLSPPVGVPDLSSKPFIAIDEDGTDDREDVVYAKRLRNGDIKLYVGFIDVSWFIRPDTEVDLYAQRVGLTLYGSRHVISTIGPDIANGPGSFLLNEPRLAWVAEINVARNGEIRNIKEPKVYRAIIRAHQHLSPQKVNEMLNGAKTKTASLQALVDAAAALRAHRAKTRKVIEITGDGAAGVVLGECMIAGNYAIAKYLLTPRVRALGVHGIFKVHTPPSPEIKKDLVGKLSELKIQVKLGDFDDPLKFSGILDRLENLNT
ncbi:MAG: RNB domain-containing ribonuclease, partial [SAR324 cluster bacterium]|nr:RNB domain-containing ribonuclease [SAR324 cluster bacterium]